MFRLKPVVVVLVVVVLLLILLALVVVLLIFRCLLCLGIGSGVLKELQQSESLLLDDDDADDPDPPDDKEEELEQAEDADSEELPHEDVLMLDDAEWLLSLILCSNEALLLEVSLLLVEEVVLPVLPPEVVVV